MAPVSTRKIPYYYVVYRNRYDTHGRGNVVLDVDVCKNYSSIFFSVHIEVLKLQKRQTYQNNLLSESSLKNFEKKTEREPHASKPARKEA